MARLDKSTDSMVVLKFRHWMKKTRAARKTILVYGNSLREVIVKVVRNIT